MNSRVLFMLSKRAHETYPAGVSFRVKIVPCSYSSYLHTTDYCNAVTGRFATGRLILQAPSVGAYYYDQYSY